MNETAQYGLVILASGESQRFGDQDKLLALFHDQPLAAQTAKLADTGQFAARVSVIRPGSAELERIFSTSKCETIVNQNPENGQGHSLALGIEAIAQHECDGAFVILADMPFITNSHLVLLSKSIGDHDVAIGFSNQRRSPPALFRRSMFENLTQISGDTGAQHLLREHASVINIKIPAAELTDIDTPEDLHRAGKFSLASSV